ncbi:MAG: hypothetical protein LBN96_01390 [Desulfovibrio sp.]|nr:hypothetical protein [Desulfovibrio sp.]
MRGAGFFLSDNGNASQNFGRILNDLVRQCFIKGALILHSRQNISQRVIGTEIESIADLAQPRGFFIRELMAA